MRRPTLLSGCVLGLFSLACPIRGPRAQAPGLPTPPPAMPGTARAFGDLTFLTPVHVQEIPDRSARFIVVELGGRLMTVDPASPKRPPALLGDLGPRLKPGMTWLEGILGFAFHPRFAENGQFFTFHTAPPRAGGQNLTLVARWTVPLDRHKRRSKVDLSTEQAVFQVETPNKFHHGGGLAFGPDGFLYVGVGDMGPQKDPNNVAQRLDAPRGKILRLDVDHARPGKNYAVPAGNPFIARPGALPEIYALGFRNPWRLSFDRQTGALWVGDVGLEDREEVDVVTIGGNYGWSVFEGSVLKRPERAQEAPFVRPVFEYGRDEGGSITGGCVYRGRKFPALQGAYVFADWNAHTVSFVRVPGPDGTSEKPAVLGRIPSVNGIGEDANGELYFASWNGGIYTLADAPAPVAAAPETPPLDETALRRLVHDRAALTRGQTLFKQMGCFLCHGDRGQGGQGPNLRDDQWLHGSNMVDIVRTIADGGMQAGMPAWKEVLSAPDIQALAAHVANLAAPGGPTDKPAQGKLAPITYR